MKDVNNLAAGIRPRRTFSTSKMNPAINRTVSMAVPTSASNAACFRFMVGVWMFSAPFLSRDLLGCAPAEVHLPQPLRRDGHRPGERLTVRGGPDRVRPRKQLGQENRALHRGVEHLRLLGRLDHDLHARQ